MIGHAPDPSFVKAITSDATEPAEAVAELVEMVDPSETCFVLAFAPGGRNVQPLAQALNAGLGGIPVFGCSSAGQITGQGYETDVLLLLVFPRKHFRCASMLMTPLSSQSTTDIAAEAQRQMRKFRHTAGWNRLGLIFTDGLSAQEDVLVSTLETVLDDLPIFGGSAADHLQFEETYVLHNGQAHRDAAVLLLLETNLPFSGIEFDHFLPAETQIVITQADPEARKVFEINGALAAPEYARLVGCEVSELCPQVFAENPLLVEFNNKHYVRAISDADDAGGLSFLAAIDDGLVMKLGQGQEIIETLQTGLDVADARGGKPDFILGFDCVLRKLEIEQKQLGQRVSAILSSNRVLGFNTYGEQHCGVHMNQTFVGVAFFSPEERDLN
ncbi:FIST N-terminal domain-containing protein [Roseobacter sp. EG26]|uniref:FIST N-terminal domain-containing protein n=1 Tax=Roseobacter sp. EG26 TaxID=3412477 RepID=UPI0026093F13|nr:FIST N-terminal domain-containing protein [uncultured Roseobacter sp.]